MSKSHNLNNEVSVCEEHDSSIQAYTQIVEFFLRGSERTFQGVKSWHRTIYHYLKLNLGQHQMEYCEKVRNSQQINQQVANY